ncbi:MAG: FAD-dependent monooxygenase [Myxococcota bacterium]
MAPDDDALRDRAGDRDRTASAHADADARLRVLALELGTDEPESALRARAAAALGIAAHEVEHLRVARKALDARRRGGAHALRFVVHADVAVARSASRAAIARAVSANRARELPPPARLEVADAQPGWRGRRAVVVGSGPAGVFAAHVLALHGVRVDVLERGPALRERGRAVARFVRTHEIDREANLLFGEGGAGTYSDGKLYTRTQHALEEPIVRALVECGAPEAIAFDARAHIGTDVLHRVLPRLRARLEALGVAFRFGVRVEGLRTAAGDADRRVTAVRTTHGDVEADAVVLAVGHSARDTLRALVRDGVVAVAKPFQLGVRVEHPQELVDRGRYGPRTAVSDALGPAYYALVRRADGAAPGVHSFCMCPGGQIVAAVSEPGLLCTNGMSNSRHSSPFANAGIVVTVDPRRLAGDDAFAGVAFQEELEARFYEAGGGGFAAPAQRVDDFLAGRASRALRATSYKLGAVPARIDALLPGWIADALRRALGRFDREIPGFASDAGMFVGVESRSSGPVRLPRDARTFRAEGFANLFPAGEGAGHAGGIMSAAIDGARAAQAMLRSPAPLSSSQG